jgi:U3 small nucleolar ribonucleoprotein component
MSILNNNHEDKIGNLILENEVADQELSLTQKKAIIRELKRRYGKDWRHIIGKDSSTLDSLSRAGKTMASI